MTGELYVIVEYCKYGNLQKYISNKRESFISQILNILRLSSFHVALLFTIKITPLDLS